MDNFIITHPWNLDTFNRSPEHLEIINAKLQQYGLLNQKNPPQKSIIKMVETIILNIANKLESGEPVWFMVFCNSFSALNTCSKLLPASFALSTAKSANISTPDELLKLFTTKRFNNYDTESFDILSVFKGASLLIMDNFIEKNPMTSKYSGSFVDFFSSRLSRRLPTIFPFVYSDSSFTKSTVDKVYRGVEANFGQSFLHMFQESCSVLYFNSPPSHSVMPVGIDI
jgi:hypothetical protein